MSSSSSEGFNKLDARAAELKEQLLRSKSQKSSRDNSLPPANNTAPKTNAGAFEKNSAGSTSHNQTSRPPSRTLFVPHYIPPQQLLETSVPADANDIAALITSISSASQDEPNEESKLAATPVASHPTASSASSATYSQALPFKMDSTRAANEVPEKPAQTPPSRRGSASCLEEGEIENGPTKAGSSTRVSKMPHKSQASISSSDSIDIAATTFAPSKNERAAAPLPKTTRGAQQHRSLQGESTLRLNQNGNRVASREFVPPSAPSRKPSEAGLRGLDGRENMQQRHELPRGESRTVGSNPMDTQAKTSQKLSDLLDHDADLKDWLALTQYFDTEARTRKLTRYRKLAEMEAEQKRIAAEQQRLDAERQKLLAEEELERGGPWRSTPVSGPPSAPFPYSYTSDNSTPLAKPDNVSPVKTPPEASGIAAGLPVSASTKRPADSPAPALPSRSTKMAKVEERSSQVELSDHRERDNDGLPPEPEAAHPASDDSRPLKPIESHPPPGPAHSSPPPRRQAPYDSSPERYGSKYRMRSPPYHRDSSPSHRYSRGGAPRGRPDQFDRGGYGYHPSRHNYPRPGSRDDHRRSFSPRGRRPYSPVRFPKHVELGRKGDSRYFMVKSFSEQNVRRCMEDGIWTTQTQNGEVLTSAFATCKNVILFFSVNKSRAFQGYARMATTPSPDTPRPKWMSGIHWETTPPFRVEWLSTTEVEFYRIGHLKNSLNEDQAVLVGKDGQEIESECGRQLLLEMEEVARAKSEYQVGSFGTGYKKDFRGRGGYHFRGGRGGKKYVKHEEL